MTVRGQTKPVHLRRGYGTRGTQVRSLEGSAVGRSRADAEDFKALARAAARRAVGQRA